VWHIEVLENWGHCCAALCIAVFLAQRTASSQNVDDDAAAAFAPSCSYAQLLSEAVPHISQQADLCNLAVYSTL
jgi:hypothetical protein